MSTTNRLDQLTSAAVMPILHSTDPALHDGCDGADDEGTGMQYTRMPTAHEKVEDTPSGLQPPRLSTNTPVTGLTTP